MTKRTIGIDMDSVLNNLIEHWLSIYNRDFQDTLTPNDITSWDIHKYVKPECGIKIYDYLLQPGFFRNISVQPFAQDVTLWLSQHYDLYIVSSADWRVCRDKGDWLQQWFPWINSKNYIFCTNKHLVVTDYLIDDYGKNLEGFKGTPLLFDSHHNQTEDRFPRLKGWLEVKKYFENELAKV